MGWFDSLRRWGSSPLSKNPADVCERDHKKDHACWDQLTSCPCPGEEVWFCNRCKRSWTAPNKRSFWGGSDTPRIWGTHQTAYTEIGIPPPEIMLGLQKLRRKKNDAS